MIRFLAMAALLPSAAHAAAFSVEVAGADGRPLAGAVVELRAGGPPPAVKGPYLMNQQDISFQPHLLVVPVGATVSFPNEDRVRHHVYSFSRPKRFDLKLYGREQTRAVRFDQPGAVTLGCNIHDRMSGVVYVTASRFTAVTDAAGRASFADAPAGRAGLAVWDPSIRAAGNLLVRPVEVASGAAATRVVVPR